MPPGKYQKPKPRVVEVEPIDSSSDSEPEKSKPRGRTIGSLPLDGGMKPTIVTLSSSESDDGSKLSQKDIASIIGVFSKHGITFSGEINDQRITKVVFKTPGFSTEVAPGDLVGEPWMSSWEEPKFYRHSTYAPSHYPTTWDYVPRVKHRASSSRRSSSGKTVSVRPKNKGILEYFAT